MIPATTRSLNSTRERQVTTGTGHVMRFCLRSVNPDAPFGKKKRTSYFWSEYFSTTRTLSPRTVIGMGTTLS